MGIDVMDIVYIAVLFWLYADVLFLVLVTIGTTKREKQQLSGKRCRVYVSIMLHGPLNVIPVGNAIREIGEDYDKNNGYLRERLRKLETERTKQ